MQSRGSRLRVEERSFAVLLDLGTRDFKHPKGSAAFRVDHSFRNAFSIEVCQLLQKRDILHQQRPSWTDSQRVDFVFDGTTFQVRELFL